MNSCDVIGWVYDGALYCEDCKPDAPEDDVSPIFADSETDCPSHCETCDAYIPECLTSDGVEYVLGEALAAIRRRQGSLAHNEPLPDSNCIVVWLDELVSNYGRCESRRARAYREILRASRTVQP